MIIEIHITLLCQETCSMLTHVIVFVVYGKNLDSEEQ